MSTKTLDRRRSSGALEKAESLKVEMLERLLTQAAEVLGSEARARRWVQTPLPALGNRAPYALLDTIAGYERAKASLYRQAYGMF